MFKVHSMRLRWPELPVMNARGFDRWLPNGNRGKSPIGQVTTGLDFYTASGLSYKL